MTDTAPFVQAHPYAKALAEFASPYRELVDAFARDPEGDWNRRFCVRHSPALALQLAIDPSLKHARWLLDEHYPFDMVAEEVDLEIDRHTRAADLCVIGRRVHLKLAKKVRPWLGAFRDRWQFGNSRSGGSSVN